MYSYSHHINLHYLSYHFSFTDLLEFHVFPRRSQDSCKELRLLLDMYKSAPKESRDKANVRNICSACDSMTEREEGIVAIVKIK